MIDKDDKKRRVLIKKEVKRLEELYRALPEERFKIALGLINSAATLTVFIAECQEDIYEKGKIEMFTQSATAPPYERERPIVKIYNTFLKSRNDIIKTLDSMLPKPTAGGDGEDDFTKF